MRQYIYKLYLKASMIIGITCTVSCSEFLDVDPPATQLVRQTVFENNATASAAMNGIYRSMTDGISGGGLSSITFLTAFSADETIWYSSSGQNALELANNNLLPGNPLLTTIWGEAYSIIYRANAVLEGVAVSSQLTPDVKERLEGEALFIRAFYHFHLSNLFGEVPYITSTDYRANTKVSKSVATDMYTSLVTDLDKSYSLLGTDYSASGGQRITPIKWTAAALLARVHLYYNNWEEANASATEVISNNTLFQLKANVNEVFLKNSSEAIYQVPTPTGTNYTNEGNIFLRAPTYASLTSSLLNAFDAADVRLANWTKSVTNATGTYYFPYKYKESSTNATGAEYSMVIRLAEVFLIRAEANAELGDLNAAIQDVDLIRDRSGLPLLTNINPGISSEGLLKEIQLQRQLELFTEWGHRWFDLKRTGKANEVLPVIKPSWASTDQLFPLPQNELLLNPNLLPQNPGY